MAAWLTVRNSLTPLLREELGNAVGAYEKVLQCEDVAETIIRLFSYQQQ